LIEDINKQTYPPHPANQDLSAARLGQHLPGGIAVTMTVNHLRRRFLQALIWLVPLWSSRVNATGLIAPAADPKPLSALPPFLDTLLPADTTPSASQLEVDKAIEAVAKRQSPLAELLSLGCTWLDNQARQRGGENFATLEEATREQLVAQAEASPPGSLPATFFQVSLALAYRHYYARRESWIGLGFSGPPQPIGFPDHAQPPHSWLR
jgi:hypothetical protein